MVGPTEACPHLFPTVPASEPWVVENSVVLVPRVARQAGVRWQEQNAVCPLVVPACA